MIKNTFRKWPIWVLFLIGGLALFRPLIISPGPVVYKEDGLWKFFAASPKLNAEKVLIRPILQQDASLVDIKHRLMPPLSVQQNSGHTFWLGTDHLGRDVFAALVYGTQTVVFIAIGATLLSLIIGVLLGILSGWYENKGWKVSFMSGWVYLVIVMLWLPVTIFTFQNAQSHDFWQGVYWWMGFTFLLWILVLLFKRKESNVPVGKKSVSFPWESVVNQMVAFMGSVPVLILIMILTSFFWQQTPLRLIAVMGLLRWPSIARYTRSEVLKLKNTPYILLADSRYASRMHFWWWEFKPHLYISLLGYMAYSMASTVSLETSLSFLGLGLPPEMPTWGGLIGSSMYHPYAWWIYIFPVGLLAFLLISLHKVGDNMLKKSSAQGRLLRW